MQPLRFRGLWIAGGICEVALVCLAVLAPASDLPSTGIGDKLEHATAFLSLTFWFSGVVSPQRYWALGSALFLFGVSLEGLQGLTALGRIADVRDAMANGLGIVVGIGLAQLGLGRWMRWVEARLPRRWV